MGAYGIDIGEGKRKAVSGDQLKRYYQHIQVLEICPPWKEGQI